MIANSLSKSFPQVQLEHGKMRAGLQTGLSRREAEAGECFRDRFWFQTKGGDGSFMSGDVFHDRDTAPTTDGWRRDFSFSACDRDGQDNLQVKVESSELVITNPSPEGEAILRVALESVAEPQTLSDAARVVFVATDVCADQAVTRVGVGQWANAMNTFEVRNGTLVALGQQDWNSNRP